MELRGLPLADGGHLAYFIDVQADQISSSNPDVLIYHHGTPGAGPVTGPLLVAARSAGFQLVEVVRPGYGESTRQPGRTVADVAPLVVAVADELGAECFATLGWSGGGPHAIATASLLPDRCVAALSLAGVAPFHAPGLDWTAGMGQDNLDEFAATLAGSAQLEAHLLAQAAGLSAITGPDIVDELGSLLPEVDRAHLTGAFGDAFADNLCWSVANGIWGWFDDDLAFASPWGFDLAEVTVPVLVWQGSEDLMVPFAHGAWLAANIPTAVPSLAAGEGHLSLIAGIGPGLERLRSLM